MIFPEALLDNLVPVHVLLPCVAGLFACGLGKRVAVLTRFLVLNLSLLSVACGGLILLHFDPTLPSSEAPHFTQLQSTLDWHPVARSPGIRFSVGVDAVNLWYLVSLPCVHLSLLLWGYSQRGWQHRDMVCLSGTTAGVLLALAARDLLLVASSATASICGILWWSHLRNGRETSSKFEPAASLIPWAVVVGATFLLGTGVAGVASLQMQEQARLNDPVIPQESDDLVFRIPRSTASVPRAQEVWRQQSATVYLAWCGAALLWAGAIPFQDVLMRVLLQLAPAPKALLICGIIPIGGYLLTRIALPLLGPQFAHGQGWVTWPVLMTLVWHIAQMTDRTSTEECVLRWTLSAQLISLLGITTGSVSGVCGGILVAIVSGWLATAWFVLHSAASHPDSGTEPADCLSGSPAGRIERLALALMVGCPGSGMFAGLWLVAAGLIQAPQQRFVSGSLLLGIVGLLWLLLTRNLLRAGWRETSQPHSAAPSRSLWSQVGGVILVAMAILMGIVPRAVLDTSGHAVGHLVQRIPGVSESAQ